MKAKRRGTAKKKIYVVSLGCSKNLVDTEGMLADMDRMGLTLAQSPDDADCMLLNTCAFTEEARAETRATIDELLQFRGARKRPLVVTGCMATHNGDALAEEYANVDALLPLGSYTRLPETLVRLMGLDPGCLPDPDAPPGRLLATPPHTAYLRIAEGCDHTCAFCAIPLIRGRFRSVPIDALVAEARSLAERGVRELSLIAEDSTYYGLDLYREFRLPELLRQLNDVAGIEWIRLLYAYPTLVSDKLIETVANCDKVCHYVDMPVQHGDDGVLKAMRRGITRERILAMVKAWRDAMPDIVLRTTVIAGFPGENEAAFENLLSMLDEARFDRVSVFRYSNEEGTRGYELPGQVDEETKEARVQRVVALTLAQAQAANEARVGDTLRVLIDCPSPQFPDHMQGRWYGQTPDIDGATFVLGEHEPGRFVEAQVMAAETFDLFAKAI